MLILYSLFTTLCLCIGFYFGFEIGRTNKLPRFSKPNLFKTKKERELEAKIKEEEEKEQEKLTKFEKIINNLNGYDGSPKGQEVIK